MAIRAINHSAKSGGVSFAAGLARTWVLPQPSALPAGAARAIQERQHRQVASFVAARDVRSVVAGMPWHSFMVTHRIYVIVQDSSYSPVY